MTEQPEEEELVNYAGTGVTPDQRLADLFASDSNALADAIRIAVSRERTPSSPISAFSNFVAGPKDPNVDENEDQ